jgi:hypothetical protein
MRARLLILTLGLVLVGIGAVPPPALAQPIDRAADAGNRINLAGRQRMLSQRIAKAACLHMRGIDPARQGLAALAAAEDFERVMVALRDGSPELGLLPEREPDLARTYTEIAAFSASFTASAKQIAFDDLHTLVVELLVQRNMAVLKWLNDTVGVIENRYGDDSIDAGRAAAVNMAGRKRMLSQKMVKELCFLSIGLGGPEVRADMARTVENFDAAIKSLFGGGRGGKLGGLPSPEIRKQLRSLRISWRPMKALLEPVAQGGDITDAVLQEALELGELLLKEADALTMLYAQG